MDLTDREKAVLDGMVDGLTDKEIAMRIGISIHTVRCHSRNLFVKLNVHTRTAAAVWGWHQRCNGRA